MCVKEIFVELIFNIIFKHIFYVLSTENKERCFFAHHEHACLASLLRDCRYKVL